ncbi:MAG: glycosyltransferase family 4 protein [Nitrospirae bacterium]|nr:glycosyltransferase family 4 protein [Nitrospirota bacterium]
MKIAVDLKAVARETMGIGVYAMELARRFPALAPAHRLTYLVRSNDIFEVAEWNRSVRFIAAPPALRSKTGFIAWEHFLMPGDFERFEADVVFFPETVVPIRRFDAPAVVTVHDLAYAEAGETLTMSKRLYKAWSARHASRRAARFIADSAYTAESMERVLGIRRQRITVVPLGVDPAVFRPVRDPDRRHLLWDRVGIGNAPYLLYAGNINPKKNIGVLIDAFREVRKEWGKDLRLVFSGKVGWKLDEIAPWMTGEWKDGIRHVGFLSREELVRLYSEAATFVYPSSHEGFGLPLAEAMACGCPVVSTRRTSIPEVVGEAGILLDEMSSATLSAAILRLLRDPGLRSDLVGRGLERARAFSWDRAARLTLDVLEETARTT